MMYIAWLYLQTQMIQNPPSLVYLEHPYCTDTFYGLIYGADL